MPASQSLPSTCGHDPPRPCDICDYIVQFIVDAEVPQKPAHTPKRLGIFEDLISDKCTHHAQLIRTYDPALGHLVADEPLVVYLVQLYTKGACLWFRDEQGRRSFSSKAFTVQNPSTILPTGEGDSSARSWIDVNMLRKWKVSCETQHAECAKLGGSQDVGSNFPTYLVDLESHCLVAAAPDMTYWALSYVWGGASQLLLTKSTIHRLQQPQSLQDTNTQSRIPLTIRHAMELAKTLDCKYFWVDSLCIVQDDDELRGTELSTMSSIFGGASVVIIAGNGSDANHGLLGLPNISNARDCPDDSIVLSNNTRIMAMHLPNHSPRSLEASSLSTWKTRGWTFQESFFARRKLFFYDGYVAWECAERCDLERLTSETMEAMTDVSIEHPRLQVSSIKRQRQVTDKRLDTTGLIAIINDFNDRSFTYSEDALDAFSGTASFLHSGSHGALGFVSGLPQALFGLSLLWHHIETTRRRPSKPGSNLCLPSWSWVGWKGARTINYWKLILACKFKDIGKHSSWRDKVSSPVQWKIYDDVDTSDTIDLPDQWSSARDSFINNTTEPPPTGWTRHMVSSEVSAALCQTFNDRLRRDDGDFIDVDGPVCHPACYYAHESDPASQYLFPLSFPRVPDKQKHLQIRLISCTTWRTRLEVGTLATDFDGSHTLRLHDEKGDLVGALDAQRVEDERQPPLHPSTGAMVEVVEIAQGTKMLQPYTGRLWQVFPELTNKDWPTEGDAYEYVWVLGIVWEQGVAYRDSIGRVMKHKWEEMKKDRIELVLG